MYLNVECDDLYQKIAQKLKLYIFFSINVNTVLVHVAVNKNGRDGLFIETLLLDIGVHLICYDLFVHFLILPPLLTSAILLVALDLYTRYDNYHYDKCF